MEGAHQPANVLWTGGWDSTFRVLDLVLTHGVPVVPYYILDTARRSSMVELATMKRIRRSLAAVAPEKADLVAPARITCIYDIAPDGDVTGRFERLKARCFLGGQYDWLARFAKQSHLDDLELCVEWYTSPRGAYPLLDGNMELVEAPNGRTYWRVRDEFRNDDLSLFSLFRFPIIALKKADMERIASEGGFREIMEQTWFCLRPVRNKPCGVCNPCLSVVKEGQARRLPRAAKIRRFFLPVSRPFRRVSEKVERLRAASI